ncbi:bifunctional [glutamine synthetase] adenylyltransferase/[glutamine synthetase]-adenylyl-L-tyrosine phosphorylase [Pyruvatibacter mobilis]|uniref:bifunctional [glutamine synthetase] adenylyltransferase/[glutamine synthetase]-adenylyl-L-tyrosine phosphorylase n=1 Tax=Pyruvatibacter mobilis TaxID=1712261 RepID=UPI003BAD2FFD
MVHADPASPLAHAAARQLFVADDSHAQRTLKELAADAGGLAAGLLANNDAEKLLAACAGNAPYLARLIQREALLLPDLLSQDPAAMRDRLLAGCCEAMRDADDMAALMRAARVAKRRLALLAAVADVAGAWPLEEVTRTLSLLADTVIEQGACWLLRQAAARGEITLADEATPTRGSGLIVLAMGKYGAFELNYSSDIDIIVFFEPDGLTFSEKCEPQSFFVRLTKDLVKLLQEPTGDGYVFRTDLRLRPDAGATNVAISAAAAESYYETMGQNWERAAMIKARPCAGDLEAGKQLMQMLTPFVWRRYLDFAAIEDIHSLKRQIHAHRGHAAIAIEGHDVKLGRGGIREIEFFVQIQQLIGGGKTPALRGRATIPMLTSLVEEGWIDPATRDDLARAYDFLRTLEHRLQMVNDEQTHRLPKTAEGIAAIAAFMGYGDDTAFRKDLTQHLETVQGHYAGLFEREPTLSEEAGSLVFTGTDDDPETLETLAGMGFQSPSSVIATVRKWHFGRIQATRAARSRELLTKLTPALLRAISGVDSPDQALSRFDRFLSGQPAGVQFFSLLYQNPALLDLLAGIMGSAPMMARYLAEHPNVLEAVIAADFYGPLPDAEQRQEEVAELLERADGFEQVLDLARIYAREQLFQIGVQVLTGTAPAREAGPAYADLATALVSGMVPAAMNEIRRDHGDLPGGEMAVIAMGKLGGREMAATSDLDLIVIYEFEGEASQSNGKRSIDGTRYYTRVCQRLISALTVPTAEGPLYEVDLRLRPSGHAGPLATRLRSFIKYHQESAWTWEKLALTRARVISATSPLMQSMVDGAIRDALCNGRDEKTLAGDVVDMRERVYRELGSDELWDIKHGRGGLVDLEFIAQTLQLIHARRNAGLLDSNTRTALEKLTMAGITGKGLGQQLIDAADRYHNLTQVLRIAVSGTFVPAMAGEALKNRLARAVDAPSFSVVERDLMETKTMVNAAFADLIERAAG